MPGRGIKILSAEKFGRQFVLRQYLPAGEDEYYLRRRQQPKPADYWRHLRSEEIETLVKNAVTADDWDQILVADPFSPHLIKHCEFSGLVRIGRLEHLVLEHHELRMPVGITNSLIISCDLGDNVAIHHVRYLAHYIVGDHGMLLNIDEMQTTNHAKFGNGIVKAGEPEDSRIWIDLMNETSGRRVMPFDGIIPADAYLWAKYRDDPELLATLGRITQNQFDSRRGFYGTVGDGCVIKSTRAIKDVKIGPGCYIKGANKLKNLTINSSEEEPTQIGEGVELVNGIIGPGCHVFYGCKAVRFVMGAGSSLKYGARLIHSFLGENSTVSCCEILNNLIFPAHEQHHNNSFLVASLLMGQSNLAAGVTIGSNHNSRANDGEIQAGRGFWPGLCTTVKHNCRFAAHTLLAQGEYTAELDVPLPFALVSNDTVRDRLVLMPAYWWMYNMYALARNAWKFRTRDQRKTKAQHIEFDPLAPDTVEEIFHAMQLLEIWTAKAHAGKGDGRELLLGDPAKTDGLEILGENIENSSRKAVIVKARQGYHAYGDMLHYYAVKNLLAFFESNPAATLATMAESLAGPRCHGWANLGGQLVSESDLQQLLADIKSGKLTTWPEIHAAYDGLWEAYPLEKQRHAYATLLELLDTETLTPNQWNAALDQAVRIQNDIRDQVYQTRAKDFQNPFRRTTYRTEAEMQAVLGTAEDNDFVKLVVEETAAFAELAESVKQRG